ncbi:hypothetical protein RHGRI_022204 [Rhododendron griersonianum]|uniref:Uncharacterized protein n=1 Tax=Rhododendron griersonianum TaxID=479676 RepID=A0AAV6JRL6_9ERIC|nr:hypothetical protein RHGRI_022204 [Rhododendron griersonianum]
MDFDRIDLMDFDQESYVAFLEKHAKLHQIGTGIRVRRLRTKLKKFNIKDKSPPKSKRKDKVVLDESSSSVLTPLSSDVSSRASEMIKPSCGVIDIFVALLTEEELNKLGGMDGVKIFAEKTCRYVYF